LTNTGTTRRAAMSPNQDLERLHRAVVDPHPPGDLHVEAALHQGQGRPARRERVLVDDAPGRSGIGLNLSSMK